MGNTFSYGIVKGCFVIEEVIIFLLLQEYFKVCVHSNVKEVFKLNAILVFEHGIRFRVLTSKLCEF